MLAWINLFPLMLAQELTFMNRHSELSRVQGSTVLQVFHGKECFLGEHLRNSEGAA